jgi:CopG family nickel-responsive transcriptional regulator
MSLKRFVVVQQQSHLLVFSQKLSLIFSKHFPFQQKFLGVNPPNSNGDAMTKITRVGVTFPPDLLNDFDEITSKMGYESRSKAIQDAVRLYVSERKWLQQDPNTEQTGVILMVYDHDVRGLESGLTEVQHEHSALVTSTLHVHIGERDCLEAIAVKGTAAKIRELSDELTTRRGVKILKTTIVTV